MNQIICSAISARRVLRFAYGGGARTAAPFRYGVGPDGAELLRAYQTGGFSESRNPVGWKLFRVAGITDLTVTMQYFDGKRPDYNPADPEMTSVYCQI